MENERPSSCEKGRSGEDRAASYLQSLGFQVIFRNYRIRGGEIDIVALDGEILVFVEVKSLPSGGLETLSYELGPRKRSRIVRTARYFLVEHPEYDSSLIRFDVIALDVPGLDETHHIRGAFTESGLA
ncbi:MAG: YraN family protein [Treponema sp.]|nr:YraN family protein [Treponema sp.]